jgi:aspartyl/glutamyl-tRNA(Asn/Gln) amidotransferase C subunit
MIDKTDKIGKIDIKELERIAFVARLKLGENDLDKINEIKENILDRIFLIDADTETETETKTPAAAASSSLRKRAEAKNKLREDIPLPPLSRAQVLANAGKNTEAGCVSVPKILEQGEE